MQVSEVLHSGNRLHLKLLYPANYQEYTSPEYTVCGVVLFQAKSSVTKNPSVRHCILIRLMKLFQSDHLIYNITFSSDILGKNETFLCGDGSGSWWQVYESEFKQEVDINLSLEISTACSGLLASLHEDTQLTDLELCGDDGSVHVHKSILAGYSPYIKTMLENSGDWKEAGSSSVKVTNFTQQTLQHLKDYVYLQKMPEDGVKELAKLASYYLMSDLKQRCAVKLVSGLTAENSIKFMKFALQYDIDLLLLAIFDTLKRGVVDIKDIDRFCNQ